MRKCPFLVGDILICYQKRKEEALIERTKNYNLIGFREGIHQPSGSLTWFLSFKETDKEYPAWHFCKKKC